MGDNNMTNNMGAMPGAPVATPVMGDAPTMTPPTMTPATDPMPGAAVIDTTAPVMDQPVAPAMPAMTPAATEPMAQPAGEMPMAPMTATPVVTETPDNSGTGTTGAL